jgi:hypothetical protein
LGMGRAPSRRYPWISGPGAGLPAALAALIVTERSMIQSDEVARILERDPAIAERFWSSVERAESPNGCWRWRGPTKLRSYPAFFIGARSVAAVRVAWFTATGELPRGGRVRHECENRECVRPSHLTWEVGRTTERRLHADGSGYLRTSAVRMARPRMSAD